MASVIPRRIVPSVRPARRTGAQVAREFRALLEAGAELRPAGSARCDPSLLLARGYTPKHRLDLFDTTYYLANVRQNDEIRFFVGYVVQGERTLVYPRIFYKDLSLVWRSASHFVRTDSEHWIGKGDVRVVRDGQGELVVSAESTTDLPLEVQTAFERLAHAAALRYDEEALELVIRRAPEDRIEAYRDFLLPRRRAWSEPRNRIHGGRKVARFRRRHDPTSLCFAAGYAPDFRGGILEVSRSTSRMYGGPLRRYRILSRNRLIQYLFMAGRRHVWIIPAQATTTELSSYGVRTVDVAADDDLYVPGYEYHFAEDATPAGWLDQIPQGYAGAVNPRDPTRADASAWLDRLPVVRQFRRAVLKQRGEPERGGPRTPPERSGR
jgi:hypothetical protein